MAPFFSIDKIVLIALARRATHILIFLAVVLFSHPASAETLSGQVFDRSGTPVPSVRIIIYCPGSGFERSVFTDGGGYFDFFGLMTGERCRLEVLWGEELVFRKYYTISESDRIRVDL